LEKPS
jgi:hypothetical protein